MKEILRDYQIQPKLEAPPNQNRTVPHFLSDFPPCSSRLVKLPNQAPNSTSPNKRRAPIDSRLFATLRSKPIVPLA